MKINKDEHQSFYTKKHNRRIKELEKDKINEEKLKGLEITMIKIRYTLVMLLMFLISIGFIGWAIVMLSGVR